MLSCWVKFEEEEKQEEEEEQTERERMKRLEKPSLSEISPINNNTLAYSN